MRQLQIARQSKAGQSLRAVLRFSQLVSALSALLVSTLLLPTSLAAQPDRTVQDLDRAWQILTELDEMASDCRAQLSEQSDSDTLAVPEQGPGESCRNFMAAMQGDLFRDYRDRCGSVEEWREEQISQRFAELRPDPGRAEAEEESAGSNANTDDPETLLDTLMRAEFVCGAGAIEDRSAHVIPIYVLLDRYQQQHSSGAVPLQERVRDLEFRQREQRERQRLQRSLESSARRQNQALEGLLDQQRRELLEQQLEGQQG